MVKCEKCGEGFVANDYECITFCKECRKHCKLFDDFKCHGGIYTDRMLLGDPTSTHCKDNSQVGHRLILDNDN